LSILCDKSVDLAGKKLFMFSYGSGCAASVFFVRVKEGYRKFKKLIPNAEFEERLA
jgi:3-hydroxy-3-methylglutaryl CoA synthase